MVLEAGSDAPQAIVIVAGAVIVGNAGGLTVIILETGANALPQASVAVHVSVTVPPQDPGSAEKVEGAEVPLIRQPPESPLVNGMVLGAGIVLHATAMSARAVIVGRVAWLTVITWV